MTIRECCEQHAVYVPSRNYQATMIFPGSANIFTIFTPVPDSAFMSQNEVENGVTETIGSDEQFDPIGTLTLIGIYFVILLLAWVYIYYIEFLGRDLIVVG